MSSPLFRKGILEAFKLRLNTKFGKEAGTEAKLFRKVMRGPLKPRADMRPCLNVADGGQKKVDGDEDESTSVRDLEVTLTLQLAANWEAVASVDDWSEQVEKIIAECDKWLPKGCGVTKCDYVDDDPLDAIFTSGATEAVWQIVFRVRYVVDATQAYE